MFVPRRITRRCRRDPNRHGRFRWHGWESNPRLANLLVLTTSVIVFHLQLSGAHRRDRTQQHQLDYKPLERHPHIGLTWLATVRPSWLLPILPLGRERLRTVNGGQQRIEDDLKRLPRTSSWELKRRVRSYRVEEQDQTPTQALFQR